MKQLKVSDNARYLQEESDAPFFYLADTAWELFHRLDEKEAAHYLQVRADQGFNVVQAVALAELDGLKTPNRYGEVPLHDLDPEKPNEAYFAFVDRVLARANALGLRLGLLPTWGNQWNRMNAPGEEVFTPDNAYVYGEFLGRRYRDAHLIWILGGDRLVQTREHRDILRAMAAGLEKGDGGAHLKTFHPRGKHTSAETFHDEAWLDFNMVQSGHTRDYPNWEMIERDYRRVPPKPVLDGEPCYEGHAIMTDDWEPNDDWFTDWHARRACYRAVFAGACGHTYGAGAVWQMFDAARCHATGKVNASWRESLDLPGATQMRRARRLLESLTPSQYFSRVPDDALIVARPARVLAAGATRGEGFALAYLPDGGEIEIADEFKDYGARWFDPRSGEYSRCETSGTTFVAPTQGEGCDWVLHLEEKPRSA